MNTHRNVDKLLEVAAALLEDDERDTSRLILLVRQTIRYRDMVDDYDTVIAGLQEIQRATQDYIGKLEAKKSSEPEKPFHLTPTAKGRQLTKSMTACLLHLAIDNREHGVRLNRGLANAAVHLRMRGLVDGSGAGRWWATKVGMIVADKIVSESSPASDRLSDGGGEVLPDGPQGDEEPP